MARMKTFRVPQRATPTPVKDPWDVEHEHSLAVHGPMASTDHIYPITVHRGFDAQFTAETLTRRYPIFEEAESHREYLVHNRSERLIIPGERYNYFTPEQLWGEDDRLRGKRQFSDSGEVSWKDDEEEESDDEEPEGQVFQQNHGTHQEPPSVLLLKSTSTIGEDGSESNEGLDDLVGQTLVNNKSGRPPHEDGSAPVASDRSALAMTETDKYDLLGKRPTSLTSATAPKEPTALKQNEQTEPEVEVALSILLHADDHVTTVVAVTPDYKSVREFFDGLDLSATSKLIAINNSFADGTLAIALYGRRESDESDPKHSNAAPLQRAAEAEVDNSCRSRDVGTDAAGDYRATPQEDAGGGQDSVGEWNSVLKHALHATVAFLSGVKNLGALMAAIDWDTETAIATIQKYHDGRVVATLVGRKRPSQTSPLQAPKVDYTGILEDYFHTVQESAQRAEFPAQHLSLALLLRTAREDLVKIGLLTGSLATAGKKQEFRAAPAEVSIAEAATAIANGQGDLSDEEYIEDLQQRVEETQKALDLARKDIQPSLMSSPTRMLELLEQPTLDHQPFELPHSRLQQQPGAIPDSPRSAPTTDQAQPLTDPSGKTEITRHTTNSKTQASTMTTEEPTSSNKRGKRRRGDSSSPPPAFPNLQSSKRRKIAAAPSKGKRKARG